jgi:hypothetical protein
MFEAAAQVGTREERCRDAGGANVNHPQTKRSYLLRSFVFCKLCGHRMNGKTRRDTAYYTCQPRHNLGRRAEQDYPDHPTSLWVREDHLVPGILSSEGVFGARRRELVEQDLKRLRSRQPRVERPASRRSNARSPNSRLVRDGPERQRSGRLAELYAEHAPRAGRLAYLLVGDRDVAEGIVQEAFVRVAGRLWTLRNPDAFDAYLRQTVLNLARGHMRRLRLQRAYLDRHHRQYAG